MCWCYLQEMTGKVVEYLVRFTDHKDDGIALVAMEMLGPVFKVKPSLLVKHKAKLKTIWKSCKDPSLKEVCIQILPELQHGYVYISRLLNLHFLQWYFKNWSRFF